MTINEEDMTELKILQFQFSDWNKHNSKGKKYCMDSVEWLCDDYLIIHNKEANRHVFWTVK